jgi:hypothetical protein
MAGRIRLALKASVEREVGLIALLAWAYEVERRPRNGF